MSKLVDVRGKPLVAAQSEMQAKVQASSRYSGLRGFGGAYDAGSHTHPDIADWHPASTSGQSGVSLDRETIMDRVQDMVRNDGWASASVTRTLDLVIGSGWTPQVDLPAQRLGLDDTQSAEIATQIENEWGLYADDPGFWCNASRQGPMASILALAFRHRVTDGECFAEIIYDTDRAGDFKTFVKVLDPARVSNPYNQPDTLARRDGVELDNHGAATGYWVRSAHEDDAMVLGSATQDWVYLERETDWGRPIMVHGFEAERAGQFRGVSPMAPILLKLKQMTRYDDAELKAAMVNAVMAGFITSSGDHDMVREALVDGADSKSWKNYQTDRTSAYEKAPPRLPAGMINFLYPGDQVTLTNPGHPNSNFEQFFRAGLRNVASTVGLTYEQLTQDWSQVNYSSARAAMLEVWRGLTARKEFFVAQIMNQIWRAWLEEAFDKRRFTLPAGAVSFEACPAAWCRVDWIGPARGYVDPLKEANAAAIRLQNGFSNLAKENAEQGIDWNKNLRMRARIKATAEKLGLSVEPMVSKDTSDPEEREEKDNA